MNDDLVSGKPCPFAIQAAYTAVRGGEPGCPDMLVLPVLEAELNGTAGVGTGHVGDNAANRLLSSLTSFDQNRLKELNRQDYFFCICESKEEIHICFDPLEYVVQVIYSATETTSVFARSKLLCISLVVAQK